MESGEPDARYGRRSLLEPSFVDRRVWSVADDDQRCPHTIQAARSAICLDHDVGVVLGLEPTDIQDVPVRLESQRRERRSGWRAPRIAPVRDVDGRLAEPPKVVIGDHPGVRDERDRQARGELGAELVVPPPESVPLTPLPFEPIDVQDDPRPGQSRDEGERGVGVVADEHDVETARQGIDDRQERVDHGVEILVADRGQDPEMHAAIFTDTGRDHVSASVDRDVMPSVDETGTQFLGERLEPAVGRGDAACPDDGDLHRVDRRRSSDRGPSRSGSRIRAPGMQSV